MQHGKSLPSQKKLEEMHVCHFDETLSTDPKPVPNDERCKSLSPSCASEKCIFPAHAANCGPIPLLFTRSGEGRPQDRCGVFPAYATPLRSGGPQKILP